MKRLKARIERAENAMAEAVGVIGCVSVGDDGRILSGHPAALAAPLVGNLYSEVRHLLRGAKIYVGFDAAKI